MSRIGKSIKTKSRLMIAEGLRLGIRWGEKGVTKSYTVFTRGA